MTVPIRRSWRRALRRPHLTLRRPRRLALVTASLLTVALGAGVAASVAPQSAGTPFKSRPNIVPVAVAAAPTPVISIISDPAATEPTPPTVAQAGTEQAPRPELQPAPKVPSIRSADAPSPPVSAGPAPVAEDQRALAPVHTTQVDRAGSGGQVTAVGSPLRAVIIVGPSGQTDVNLGRAEELAAAAESFGMDVRRVYHPRATWAAVLDNIQGANFVAYFGHGNSWPSPYGPFQERTKDGFGLNVRAGGSVHQVKYYGADFIRRQVTLAPNAVVVLSHLCYSAGNAEPGLPVPSWDVARQRVDNYASGFLASGAAAVFAYGTGSAMPILNALFETDSTMDAIFMTPGARRQPFYGFTGWDDRYFDSARTPGAQNHMDPGRGEGFLRAVSGDLSMTSEQWRAGR